MSTDYKTLLSLLLPPNAYSTQQKNITAELTAEGYVFNSTALSAASVIDAITPFDAGNLLSDWERVLGLTTVSEDPYQKRLDAVLIKLAETGGISSNYFISMAERIGYTITIDELQPFRTGSSRCGDTLYIEDIIFTWRINVYGLKITMYYFRPGISRIGENLMTYGDKVLESIFNNLKPAHTLCYFRYASEILEPFYLDGSENLDGVQELTGYLDKVTD